MQSSTVERSDNEALRELKRSGESVRASSAPKGMDGIRRALRKGDDQSALERIARAEITSQYWKGRVAILGSKYGCVRSVASVVDSETAQKTRDMGFIMAAGWGQTPMCNFWYDHKGNVDAREPKYWNTPVLRALRFMRLGTAARLIELNADLRLYDHYYYDNAIHVASIVQDEEVGMEEAKMLLGADPELLKTRTGGGYRDSVLHLTSRYPSRKRTVYFLERGADPNAPNAMGVMPLDVARRTGDQFIIDKLTDYGAVLSEKTLSSRHTKSTLSRAGARRIDYANAMMGQ